MDKLAKIESSAKDTWKLVISTMEEYKKVKESGEPHSLIDIKDDLISIANTVGYFEAEYKELADKAEIEVEELKVDQYLFYRGKQEQKPQEKYTEKDADYKARKFAMGARMDYANFNKQYKRFRNAREAMFKAIDSISQRVSLIKMEQNTNQFTT